MTNKQRVLRKYSTAVCLRTPTKKFLGYDVWHRIDTVGGPIGSGHSAAQAWKMAWMRVSL